MFSDDSFILMDESANESCKAAIIDGILYNEDHYDFLITYPKTDKELKRVLL
jgi:hypothetical protein